MNAFVFVLVQVNLPPKNKPELTQTNSTFIFSLHFSYFKYNLFCLARAISRDVLPQIKHLLDENLLYEYLMEYGIVRSGEDMELITSSYYKPEDRISSLFDIVFNNCQTRGKAEDRAGVQTLTEVYSLHKISALWAF